MDSIGRAASDFNDNSAEEGNYFLRMALPQPVRCGQGHFTLGHILGASMVATYVDATLTPTLSLWERVGVRVPQ